MAETAKKPQLTQSKLGMFFGCQVAFCERYGEEFGVGPENRIVPPSIALATGSSVHKSVETNMRTKLETGRLADLGQVKEVARDTFNGLFQEGLFLTEEEATNQAAVKGEATDMVVSLAELHHTAVAPLITPIAVEEPFTIEMDGYPFNVGGKIDVRESGDTLADTKTAKQSPGPEDANSLQSKIYAWGRKVMSSGSIPSKVRYDYLVKTKTPKYVPVTFEPKQRDIDAARQRFDRATEIIVAIKEGRVAPSPANPDEGWRCTERYCGYSSTCPFASGRKK